MKLNYFTQLAIVSILGVGFLAGCNTAPTSNNTNNSPASDTANPCAAKTNPCAAKTNPCAAKNSQQGKTEPEIFADKGVAIRGYDPVAYFTDSQPVKGKQEFAFEWKGSTWQFSSAANRDLFAKEPEKYAPQYGGYCAFAVSEGYLAPIDPEAWKVVNGKLYLNYDKGIQKKWSQDIPGRIANGDKNWPGVLSQK